jgi:hypothetical protein
MTEKKSGSSLVSHRQSRPLSQSQRLLNNKRAAAKVKLRPFVGGHLLCSGAKMRPSLRTLLDMHSDTPPVNSTYF